MKRINSKGTFWHIASEKRCRAQCPAGDNKSSAIPLSFGAPDRAVLCDPQTQHYRSQEVLRQSI